MLLFSCKLYAHAHGTKNKGIVIRYKVYSKQHARAGTKIQHVIYEQLARAGQNM